MIQNYSTETTENDGVLTVQSAQRRSGGPNRRNVHNYLLPTAGRETRRNSSEALQKFCWVVGGILGDLLQLPGNLRDRPYFAGNKPEKFILI